MMDIKRVFTPAVRCSCGVLFCLFLTAGLCGCSMPHLFGSKADQPQAASADLPARDSIAALACRIAPGTAAKADTQYGSGSEVAVLGEYTSGLGEPCRRVVITAPNGVRHRYAVCSDGSEWYAAPQIFESDADRAVSQK